MGNCFGGDDTSKYELRILVLGTAACGKSTFARQMKILYNNGFTNEEVYNYKNILVQNLMLGLRELILYAEEIEAKFPKKLTKVVKFFRDGNAYTTQLDDNVVEKANSLWNSDPIKDAVAKTSRKFEFSESLLYVMENIDKISKTDWSPSNEDILHVRQRTTGIVETKFKIDKYLWTLIDVGGQRVERRKWIHSQQGLHAMIFFAALDEYDIEGEDGGKLGMQESLDVWEETVNGEFTRKIPVILFLNKKDLFEEKIKRIKLSKTFKNYKGGKDFDKATEFIKQLYLDKVNGEHYSPDDIYTHVTCAIDTENVRVIFEVVKDHIFKTRLRLSGL